MKEEFEITKEEIDKEYRNNWAYIEECKEKANILSYNTDETNYAKIFTLAMVSFFPMLMLNGHLFSLLNFANLGALKFLTATTLIMSLGVGKIGQKLITKNSKRKMKRFTNAKTNAEILEEENKYEIEIEKAKNKNTVLERMYRTIEGRENVLRTYSNEIEFKPKNDTLTREEQLERKDKLTSAYKKEMSEIDTLTTKKYLRDKFKNFRNKKAKKENLFSQSLMCALPFCLIIGMPLAADYIVSLNTFVDFLKMMGIVFSPSLLIAPIAGIILNKRDNDYLKAFRNLNKTLGDDALSESVDKESEKQIDAKLRTKTNETIELGLSLKSITRALERKENEIVEDLTEEKEQTKNANLDWVEPYLEEDIEEDYVQGGKDNSYEGYSKVKK